MKFIMGDFMGMGMIGIGFYGMGYMLLSYLLVLALVLFAFIGLIASLKRLFVGKKKSKYKYFKD